MVTAWCVGEYGEMLLNNAGLLDGETPLSVRSQPVWPHSLDPMAQSAVAQSIACMHVEQHHPA